MARKAMAKKKKAGSAPLPGWVWLVTGLMIGLFVAFLVHIKDNYPALSLGNKEQPSQRNNDTRGVRKQASETVPPREKTRFDFYTILPEMEIAVPDDEIGKDPASTPGPALQQPGNFILQTGSFKTLAQADRMKASLALLGLEASIQTVTINKSNTSETWHRVRIGPYHDLAELNRARSRLRSNNIDAILLKLKS